MLWEVRTGNGPHLPDAAPMHLVAACGVAHPAYLDFGAAVTITVTVCPAIVAVAVREPPLVPGTCSVAIPDPLPPPVTFIHPVLLRAVQAQSADVVTCT